MKKFIMVTPLQPVGIDADGKPFDHLRLTHYEAVGNSRLHYDKPTRFPLSHLIHGYAQPEEEIQVISITPDYSFCQIHLEQLQDEVSQLQREIGFHCKGVEAVHVQFAGDVSAHLDIFQKLLNYFEDGDILYGCLTFGMKPMPMAELMAIQYAYRVMKNVSIGCLVYGEVDYSSTPAVMRVFDITPLAQMDEIVRTLAAQKVSNPKKAIDMILGL